MSRPITRPGRERTSAFSQPTEIITVPGPAGDSAYEIWRQQPGNDAGTIDDYLAWLQSSVDPAITAHNSDTTDVHGIADTSQLALRSEGQPPLSGVLTPPKWYAAPSGNMTTGTTPLNQIELTPFWVPRGGGRRIDALAVETTTAAGAGGLLRLGCWADRGDSFPGALIQDFGTVAVDGPLGIKTLSLAQPWDFPDFGLYWLGLHSEVAGNSVLRRTNGLYLGIGHITIGNIMGTAAVGYYTSLAAGVTVLPDPFPATPNSAASLGRIALRAAA